MHWTNKGFTDGKPSNMRNTTLRFTAISISIFVLLLIAYGFGMLFPQSPIQLGFESPLPPFEWPQVSSILPKDSGGQITVPQQAVTLNITLWPTTRVKCDVPYDFMKIRIYTSVGNDPLVPALEDAKVSQERVDGIKFPVLSFSQIPIDVGGHSNFTVVIGSDSRFGRAYVLGQDSKTNFPNPIPPTGTALIIPPEEKNNNLWEIDSRIQMVWPHTKQGKYTEVKNAEYVNVAVDYFRHGTLESLPIDFPSNNWQYYVLEPYLMVAEDSNPFIVFGKDSDIYHAYHAQRTTYIANGKQYPRWIFDDVPVKIGHDYHFIALWAPKSHAQGFRIYPSVWTHSAGMSANISPGTIPGTCIP